MVKITLFSFGYFNSCLSYLPLVTILLSRILTSTNAFYIASLHMDEAIYQTANISSPAKTFCRLGCPCLCLWFLDTVFSKTDLTSLKMVSIGLTDSK